MKTCKTYYEQIIHFDEITKQEQEEVRIHLQECAGCRKTFREFRAIFSSLKVTGHIDDEDLTRFGIHLADPKSPDFDGKKLSKKKKSAIKKHIDTCRQCRGKVEEVQKEFAEIEVYLEKSDLPDLEFGRTNPFQLVEEIFEKLKSVVDDLRRSFSFAPRLVPAAVATFAVLFIVLWISPLFRGESSQLLKLATVEKEQVQFLTRGAESQALSQGLRAFNEGDYQQAINYLEQYVENAPADASSAFAHQAAGTAYLLQAKSGFLGRFIKINEQSVQAGIGHLQSAIKLAESNRLKEQSYWYLGKGYLLLGDVAEAKNAFTEVLEFKGMRRKEAEKMIGELGKIGK